MSKNNRAFIFLEPLIFVAFIGIGIFSVAIVGVTGGARDAAQDTRIMEQMSQVRSMAEMHYSQGFVYDNMCTDSFIKQSLDDMAMQTGATPFCEADGQSYCVSSQLVSDPAEYVCVSASGGLGEIKCTSAHTDCK